MSLGTRLFGTEGDIVTRRSFQLLILANVTTPLGEALVSPILDDLTGAFGVDPTRIGLILTAFSAPAIVLIPLAGILVDRYGRKPILVSGLLIYGAAGSAITLAPNFEVALALRLLQGSGHALVLPTLITIIGDRYDGEAETTAQGVRFASSGLSQMTFPLLAAILVGVAWQAPFLLYAMAIPVAGLLVRWLDDPATDAETGPGLMAQGVDIRELLAFVGRPPVAAVVVGRGLPEFLYIGFLTFNSILVVTVLGYTAFEAGVMIAISSLVFALGAAQTGRVRARFGSTLTTIVVANGFVALGLLLVAAAPSLVVLGAGICVFSFGFGTLLTIYRSVITQLPPATLRGSFVSVGEATGRLFATTVPVLVGALIAFGEPIAGFDGAVRASILVVAGAGVLVGLGCIAVMRVWNVSAELDEPTAA